MQERGKYAEVLVPSLGCLAAPEEDVQAKVYDLSKDRPSDVRNRFRESPCEVPVEEHALWRGHVPSVVWEFLKVGGFTPPPRQRRGWRWLAPAVACCDPCLGDRCDYPVGDSGRSVPGQPHRAGGSPGGGAIAVLTVLGLLASGIGLWYLFNPSVGPSEVVNLQRLTMGETFTIAGALFLGAAWRPR